YWVSTVGHNEAAVRLYIREQEKEDQRLDQLGLFAGESRFERLQE
ncbi:MAG: IS200/IS605 family transposase, partial [Verrucomicrobia bacterium]